MSQIAEAFVRVRPDTSGFKAEATRSVSRDLRNVERQLQNTNREMSRFGRGALVGTGALRELGRAAAFASLSFIGGAGIVVGLKSTISAAMEAERVVAQTRNAVERAGVSWEEYGQLIQDAALQQAQISGFDDEQLLGTFSRFLRITGTVNKALKDNALAADIARGANIELEQASKIVARAEAGQARGLANLGVEVRKGATSIEILTALNEKFAGSSQRFADTAAGAQSRFNVALDETAETIGRQLLPVLTEYLNKVSDWLNKSENQEKIEKRTKQAVSFTTTSVELLTDAYAGLNKAYDVAAANPANPIGMFERARQRADDFGSAIFSVADKLGLVAEETQRINTVEELLWAARKRRNLQPALGIFGYGNEINQIIEQAADAADAADAAAAERTRSPAQTRAQQTLTDLAAAQAGGQRSAITAAAQARLAFIRDTIDFANKLLREGRGDTAKLSQTLQRFYGEQEAVNGILEDFARQDEQARQDRIDAAKDRAAKWRDQNHQYHLAVEAMLKQGREFHEEFKRQVAQDAEDARRRLEVRDQIRLQTLQNQLAGAQLKGDTDRGIQAQKTALRHIVNYYRDQAKNLRLSVLERKQAQGEALNAQRALNDLSKRKADGGGGGFTLQELFQEAGDEFAMYGSNIGPRGSSLSAQDARGALAQTIKASHTTIVQNFNYPVGPSQAMNDARASIRNVTG